ncbi:hypothetical protein N0V84_010343 [Fusarium piperis]|uniref:Uncharacterized protein n=1 Tax=Fusarium piperis TaxID=1435070 RepID=A0A9W8TFL9_9HYPO|nr:hypothetical protein N0V84_010343 [Fusarium piperis]
MDGVNRSRLLSVLILDLLRCGRCVAGRHALTHESIQAFAKKCETLDRIDFAILNAGTQNTAFTRSPEGHESTFQDNYLSTVLLATLLLPTLKKKATAGNPGRLTIVNSGTSLMVKVPNPKDEPALACYDDESKFSPLALQGARPFLDPQAGGACQGGRCYRQPRGWIADTNGSSYAKAVYEADEQELAGRIWDETLEMLSFVDIDGILNSLSQQK